MIAISVVSEFQSFRVSEPQTTGVGPGHSLGTLKLGTLELLPVEVPG
jgi:hypothetical protein